MKSLLIALLLCIPAFVSGQIVDEDYNTLADAAKEITLTQQGWNVVCGADPTQGTCQTDKEKIDFLTTIWIAEAKKFKALGAESDCAVDLRNRIIVLQIAVFQWNLEYQNQQITNEQKAKALREQTTLKSEEEKLLKDIDECSKNRNSSEGSFRRPRNGEEVRL